MNFSLLVLSDPARGAGATTALRFARAAIAAGHTIRQVFLHGDGVALLHGAETPADEWDLRVAWRDFAREHGIALLACESAAARRGAVAEGQGAAQPGTLGQFVVALAETDRLVSFAG